MHFLHQKTAYLVFLEWKSTPGGCSTLFFFFFSELQWFTQSLLSQFESGSGRGFHVLHRLYGAFSDNHGHHLLPSEGARVQIDISIF